MALSGIPKNTHFLWHVQKNVFFRKSQIPRSATPDSQLDQPLSSIDHFLWQTTLPMTGQIGDLKFWISDNEPRVWGRFLVGQRGETPLFFQHLLCFSGLLEQCRKKGEKTHFFAYFFPKIWHSRMCQKPHFRQIQTSQICQICQIRQSGSPQISRFLQISPDFARFSRFLQIFPKICTSGMLRSLIFSGKHAFSLKKCYMTLFFDQILTFQLGQTCRSRDPPDLTDLPDPPIRISRSGRSPDLADLQIWQISRSGRFSDLPHFPHFPDFCTFPEMSTFPTFPTFPDFRISPLFQISANFHISHISRYPHMTHIAHIADTHATHVTGY